MVRAREASKDHHLQHGSPGTVLARGRPRRRWSVESYTARMANPWASAIAMLWGPHVAPAVRWPADRCRVIAAAEESAETEAPTLTPAEAEILEAITRGLVRPPALAAELDVDVGAVNVRLHRMHARGLVHRESRGVWMANA